jgi:hypothetical protein
MNPGSPVSTLLTGQVQDISHIAEFGWYDWVWHHSIKDSSKQNIKLGQYCGPSYDIGEALCSLILTDTAELLSRTSVFPLSIKEQNSDAVKEMKGTNTDKLNEALSRKGRKSTPIDYDADAPNTKYLGGSLKKPDPYKLALPDSDDSTKAT